MNSIKTPAKQDSARNIPPRLLASIIITACALLALEPELRLAVPLLVGATAVMVIALACCLYQGEQGLVHWPPKVILGVALLLRLMFLFGPPQLSDDIYRYLWDGSSLLSGINPYAAAPSTITPPVDLQAIHAQINHPDYVTIYPPMAQVVFAGGAAMGGTITGLKIFLVLIDMGLCALVIILLRQLEMPAWRAVIYAWNPLPVLEIAGSGHVDGAGLAMLLGACCLLLAELKNKPAVESRRWPFLLSGVILASAGLIKLFPLVLAPALYLLVPGPRRKLIVSGFLGAMAVLLLPFLPYLTNMLVSLDAYARDWEFAGFAFTTLRTLTDSGIISRIILSGLFLMILVIVFFRLTVLICGASAAAEQGRLALHACYAVAMALLLLTPTLQPWYALCLAVFLPFCAGPAGLLLCWAVLLTYRVQIPYFILGQWIEDSYVTAAVFGTPLTAWLLGRFFRVSGRQPVS